MQEEYKNNIALNIGSAHERYRVKSSISLSVPLWCRSEFPVVLTTRNHISSDVSLLSDNVIIKREEEEKMCLIIFFNSVSENISISNYTIHHLKELNQMKEQII